MEATYTKCETAQSLHSLSGKDKGGVKGRDRTKGRGSNPSRQTRAGEGIRAPSQQYRAPQSTQSRPSNLPPQDDGGRVYVMSKEEAENAPNVVTGTFSF